MLEIGAGTGQQAKMLHERGFDVVAIDVSTSHYRLDRVFDVIEYDGRSIPCAPGSIDVVFTSNVLEHIRDIDPFLEETARVMAPGGIAIHILPSSTCRIWSIPAHYVWLARRLLVVLKRKKETTDPDISVDDSAPKRPTTFQQWIGTLFPTRHGERGTTLTEGIYYSRVWWRRRFMKHNLIVVRIRKNGLFYTMANALGDRLSMETRAELAKLFGSACHVYVLRKAAGAHLQT